MSATPAISIPGSSNASASVTTSVTVIASADAWEVGGVYSPDGQWIAFQGNMEGNFELYVMPATGGEPQRITTTDADENLVDWTPDGALYYTTAEGDTNLWYMDVESALP